MAGKSSKSKKPTHEAFVVTGEGESAFWTKLGAVWPHDDGKGVQRRTDRLTRYRTAGHPRTEGRCRLTFRFIMPLCAILPRSSGEARWCGKGNCLNPVKQSKSVES